MASNIRISDKQNILLGSPLRPKQATIFKVHLVGENAAYYQGRFVAPGHNASDAKCIRAYRQDLEGAA